MLDWAVMAAWEARERWYVLAAHRCDMGTKETKAGNDF